MPTGSLKAPPHLRTASSPRVSRTALFSPAHEPSHRQDMISYSGISIFLLGNKKENGTTVLSNGMRSEYEISKKQGNFLIPIGRTGYISKELWKELLDEKQDDHTFDIYRRDIESLGDNTKTLDEVIEIVIELIKKVK